jgi:hypothetical protein
LGTGLPRCNQGPFQALFHREDTIPLVISAVLRFTRVVLRRSIVSFLELMELLVLFDLDDLDRLATLLDVDGAILDIAPSPRKVQVPNGLVRPPAVPP